MDWRCTAVLLSGVNVANCDWSATDVVAVFGTDSVAVAVIDVKVFVSRSQVKFVDLSMKNLYLY